MHVCWIVWCLLSKIKTTAAILVATTNHTQGTAQIYFPQNQAHYLYQGFTDTIYIYIFCIYNLLYCLLTPSIFFIHDGKQEECL